MSTASSVNTSQLLQQLATEAGLTVVRAASGTDFTGATTVQLQLGIEGGTTTHTLEISESFGAQLEGSGSLRGELQGYLHVAAKRLKSPRPDVFVTLHGLPLSMREFRWPYHRSTSGADSYILHGVAQLAESESALHAKVSASLTVTFAEVLPSLEQPYAESVTFNAIRKTLDLGQLELLKSGNRQPVPVSTRYYSFRQKRFIFNEVNEQKRKEFLRAKVFWNGARLGHGAVWLADPYDAQYLDASADQLKAAARDLAGEGWLQIDASGEYASATQKLAAEQSEFIKQMESALALLKPKFNEEMRAGHTNM